MAEPDSPAALQPSTMAALSEALSFCYRLRNYPVDATQLGHSASHYLHANQTVCALVRAAMG
jgi:hypothetical protein